MTSSKPKSCRSALPLLLNLAWLRESRIPLALLPWLLAPLAAVISIRIFRTEPGRIYNKYLALGALQLLLFAVLVTIGWFL